MKRNMGMTDRIIRFMFSIIFGFIFYMNLLPGIWDEVLLFFGFIMLFTAIVGFCPVYYLLGFNTKERKDHHVKSIDQ